MSAALAAVVLSLATLASPDAGEAKRRLESTKVTVDFKNASVEEVVESIRSFTGLSFVLHPDVPGKRDVTLRARAVSAKTVLKLVLGPRGLAAVWRDGAILIAPRNKLNARTIVRLYDVRTIQIEKQDFSGPVVDLKIDSGLRPLSGVIVLSTEGQIG